MAHSQDKFEEPLADFTRDKRILFISGLALIVGAVSAFVALVLVWLIALITNVSFYGKFSMVFQSPAKNRLGLGVVIVPVLGGLLIGFIAKYGSEKIRGHGIPEALEAILFGRSRMDAKVAILKPISSAVSIGTGGPFGAEGPIIMTGGAIGSLIAQAFNLSAAERKTLLVAGAAGGMAAIFNSPAAAVLIAVELLLFEWRPRSFVPVAIAAVTAAALRVPLLGSGPIFPITPHSALPLSIVPLAFAAGLAAGLASCALTALVYGFEDLFTKLPFHWMWWPAIGGLFVGIGGFLDPRVLGVGYDTIHSLLNGELLGAALIGLLIGKALVWSIALGSGTSGGVLAPLLILGGALGATEATIFHAGDPGLWVAISMAAIMGGTMRSPLTAMVFLLELTHDINVLPLLLVACVAAHAVTVLILRRSILTEKIARRGYHITREYSVDPLSTLRVRDVMDTNVATIPCTMKLAELSERIARHDPELSHRQATPIVDDQGCLTGIITRGDLIRAVERGSNGDSVLEAGSRDLIVTFPGELLYTAIEKMLRRNIGRLPVVSPEDHRKLVGYLGRSGILQARLLRFDEEQVGD